MKKKLDVSALQNELQTGSAFFRKAPTLPARSKMQVSPPSARKKTKKQAKRASKTVRNSERKTERTEKRSEFRSEKRSVALPHKRHTKRYSFEFYTDQLATLKRLEAQAMLQGEGFNKSDFVRKALDNHFAKLKIKLVEPKE